MLYGFFPSDFLWGAATSAFQVLSLGPTDSRASFLKSLLCFLKKKKPTTPYYATLQVEGWGDDDRGLAGCEFHTINRILLSLSVKL